MNGKLVDGDSQIHENILQDGKTPIPVPSQGQVAAKQLCQSCRSLDLRPEHFVVSNVKATKSVGRSEAGSVFGFSFKARGVKRTHASLLDMQQNRESCDFCALMLDSVVSSIGPLEQHPDLSQDSACSINWEIDGRRLDRFDQVISSTRRLHLTWNSEKIPDSYLVLVAPNSYLRPNSDMKYNWGPEALYLGRKIDPDRSNDVLMVGWLESCRKNHGKFCCRDPHNEDDFNDMLESTWFGVIDVLHMRLTTLPPINSPAEHDAPEEGRHRYVGVNQRSTSPVRPHEPFVALSYVWGPGNHYTTTRDRVALHRKPGGLETVWKKLPKTIQDAIGLVKTLGYRYMWIDALCIVQDSDRSWKLNASHMDRVYGNADFTICAADDDAAEFGLKAIHPEHRLNARQNIRQCGDVNLMAVQLAEQTIKQSYWNLRAWTFQERILSRRCLIFCKGRVFFQCRQTSMSEDIVAEPTGAGWSLDISQAPHQMLHDLQERPISVYMSCVRLYSARMLTKSRDIVAAFSGVINLLEKQLHGDVVFGLPTSHFDLALLWQASGAVSRRCPNSKNRDERKKEADSFMGMEFPSWSWSGWEAEPNGPVMEYNSEMIEGCLVNVHEWLVGHTWIRWYIRNGEGELRPLRDGSNRHSGRDRTQKRWQGYGTRHPRPGTRAPRVDLMEHKKRLCSVLVPAALEALPSEVADGFGRTPSFQDMVNVWEDESSEDGHRKDDRRTRPSKIRPRHRRGTTDSPNSNDSDPYWVDQPDEEPDEYGRSARPARYSSFHFQQDEFSRTYADSPYRVRMAKEKRRPSAEFPDQPILQFWTWLAELYLVSAGGECSTTLMLERYDILDMAGDWCGTIMLDATCNLVTRHRMVPESFEPRRYEFIAISDAKSFNDQECETWTYYTPKKRDQSEWDLFYVLLVERRGMLWYRVALGKVFKTAFDRGNPAESWKEIILG